MSVVVLAIGAALAYLVPGASHFDGLWIPVGAVVFAFFVSSAIQVADHWNRVVVLRLGKFRSLEGPGFSGLFR
jgi:regulator of protease activity HflC (stomatin/prohibitin superfamily)